MSGSIPTLRSSDWAWRSAFATVFVMLSACGGSGGGDTSAPTPAPAPAPSPTPSPAPAPAPSPAPAPAPAPAAVFDLNSAIAKIYTGGFATRTLTGTSTTGLSATQAWAMTAQTDEVFEGSSRKVISKNLSTTVTVTLTGAVAKVDQNYKVYFNSPPLVIHGSALSVANSGITVTTPRQNLPASATISQTGDFYSAASYSDAAKSPDKLAATSVVTWSLEADGISDTTAFACLNEVTTQLSAPTSPKRSSECYRIDQSGNLLGVMSRVTVDDPTTGSQTLITLK